MMCRGKNKCGATACRLVCWVAPFLILSKRWLFFSFFVYRFTGLSVVLQCPITLSICKVGDCGLQTYQTVTILKRATAVEFTTITPILYIHCCMLVFILQSQSVSSFNKFNSFLINLHRR
jgi:hypothetical protein